jgi:hypothetical protein
VRRHIPALISFGRNDAIFVKPILCGTEERVAPQMLGLDVTSYQRCGGLSWLPRNLFLDVLVFPIELSLTCAGLGPMGLLDSLVWEEYGMASCFGFGLPYLEFQALWYRYATPCTTLF